MDIAKKFRDLAKNYPKRPFIIFRDQPISYQEIAVKVNKLANALQKVGVKKTGDNQLNMT